MFIEGKGIRTVSVFCCQKQVLPGFRIFYGLRHLQENKPTLIRAGRLFISVILSTIFAWHFQYTFFSSQFPPPGLTFLGTFFRDLFFFFEPSFESCQCTTLYLCLLVLRSIYFFEQLTTFTISKITFFHHYLSAVSWGSKSLFRLAPLLTKYCFPVKVSFPNTFIQSVLESSHHTSVSPMGR